MKGKEFINVDKSDDTGKHMEKPLTEYINEII